MSKSLKIEYGSTHELFETFKRHPQEVELEYKQYADANKDLDTANMELEIVTAEIVKEICEERFKKKSPSASAKQEIRRAEVQLDPRWKIKKNKVIDATSEALVLKGRINGMYSRSNILELLGKAELKMMYIDPTVFRDNRNPDTKLEAIEDDLDLPEED